MLRPTSLETATSSPTKPKNGGRLLSLSYPAEYRTSRHSSELLQYAHDEAGDLYLLAQGGDLLGFYQNSLIYRIRHVAMK